MGVSGKDDLVFATLPVALNTISLSSGAFTAARDESRQVDLHVA